MASTPATPPATPADPRDEAFLREVDDAYRADELGRFARSWGRWILLAVGLGLAALGGFLFWQSEQARRAGDTSIAFTQALDKLESGATTEAVEALGAIADGRPATYAGLARMAQAGIASTGGDTATAIRELEAVVADQRQPGPIRDAATMKLLRLQFDELAPAQVIERTGPYLDGDNPWFPVAGEMAALAHLKAGAPDKAGPLFLRIAADGRAPASLRARAEQMAAALGQDVSTLAAAPSADADAGDAAPAPAAAAAGAAR